MNGIYLFFHTNSNKLVTGFLDRQLELWYVLNPSSFSFSYLIQLLWELKVIKDVNLTQCPALSKHSIYVSLTELHSSTDYNSIFQMSSILRESNSNQKWVQREKPVRTKLSNLLPFSQGQIILSTGHNDILTLHSTTPQ